MKSCLKIVFLFVVVVAVLGWLFHRDDTPDLHTDTLKAGQRGHVGHLRCDVLRNDKEGTFVRLSDRRGFIEVELFGRIMDKNVVWFQGNNEWREKFGATVATVDDVGDGKLFLVPR